MKILLIRPRLIGDVVFTTPAIRALRRRFTDAWISYLVESEAARFSSQPAPQRSVVAPRPRGWHRLRGDLSLARQLRRARFDLLIDLHGGPRSSWLAWATRAPKRIGYDVVGRGWMYTTRVHRPRELRPRHSVHKSMDLLGPLGIDPRSAPRSDGDARKRGGSAAAVRLATHRGRHPTTQTLIVVHVSAGTRSAAGRRRVCGNGRGSGAAIRHAASWSTYGPSDAGARQRIIERRGATGRCPGAGGS